MEQTDQDIEGTADAGKLIVKAFPVQLFKINELSLPCDTSQTVIVENQNGTLYYVIKNPNSNNPIQDIPTSCQSLNNAWIISFVDEQSQGVLKYDGMLRNMDKLLQQLNETDVTDLSKQFLQLIHNKFKQNEEILP